MNRVRGLAVLVLLGSIVAGCGGQASAAEATSHATRAPGTPSGAARAAAAINDFGFDFYRTALTSGGNAVVSPAGIAMALSMARAGAAGETGSQMDAVLHSLSAGDINALAQALGGIPGTFKDTMSKDQEVALRIADAAFAQREEQFEQAYLDTLASSFGAGLRLVDFAGDPAGAVREIDGWVSDQTQARIPKLLDTLDPLTRLVLVNAIYMKAPWLSQFDDGNTAPAPFTRLDGSQVSVPTMSQGIDVGSYAAGTGWQAVELPYLGGSLAMTIVVPSDLTAFEGTLSGARFTEITSALKRTSVELTLPRFKAETKVDLVETLTTLGMPLAFDSRKADFSAITKSEPLFISAVAHQANISVDEKGTEATAATAVVVQATASPAPAPVVHVDRPFIFAVRDTKSGAILFLGRVMDPSA